MLALALDVVFLVFNNRLPGHYRVSIYEFITSRAVALNSMADVAI